MADTERKFSELVNAGVFDGTEIMAMSQMNVGTLLSVKATLQAIANWFAVNSQYASALDTSNKTLCGAINELKQLISLIPQFSIEVVQTLPVSDISETTIYLVPNSDPEQGNYYDEYIYVNNTWELVGTTAVDLSAYYTKLEVDTLLAAKANTSDVTAALALKEAKSDLDDDVTDILVALTDEQTTASGNPVTLTTEQSGGAKSALVTFAPKQSGTGDPSPENIRPFVLWSLVNLYDTGKNIFDKTKIGALNRYITATGQVTTPGSGEWRISDFIPVVGGTTFTLSGMNATANAPAVCWYSAARDNATIDGARYNENSEITFTVSNDAKYIRFSVMLDKVNDAQLELGNKATTYEPYKGNTHTATFDEPVACGVYDFTTGAAVIDRFIKVLDGTENYSAQSNNRVYTNSITDIYIPTVTDDVEVLCSHFKGVSYDDRADGTVYKVTGNYAIYFRDVTYCTDATTFKNYVEAQYNNNTPVTVLYKLATPIKLYLPPADVNLLKGANVLWTDGDTVQVKYSELPNGNLGAVIDYIQKLEARIAALES